MKVFSYTLKAHTFPFFEIKKGKRFVMRQTKRLPTP